MSLYGYPREPEPSEEDAFGPSALDAGPPTAPPPPPARTPTHHIPPPAEPFGRPPAPLLPPEPPGFAPAPAQLEPNGGGPYSNGDRADLGMIGRIPGPRRAQDEFPPPASPPPGQAQRPLRNVEREEPGGWRSLLPPPPAGRPEPAAPEPTLAPPAAPFLRTVDPLEPSSFGISGRHRTHGPTDDDRPAGAAPAEGSDASHWLGPSPTMGQPPVSPEAGGLAPWPPLGQPTVERPGFGPPPSAGQPPVDRPAFGPSPPVGQPAVLFGQPGAPAYHAPPEPPTVPPGPGREPAGSGGRVSEPAGSGGRVSEPAGSGGRGSEPAGSGGRGTDRMGTIPGGSPPKSVAPVISGADGMPTDADIAALLDEPEIVPWDRRPLLVVIAAVVALVLIGILSGFITAKIVDSPSASWLDTPSSAEAKPSGGG